MTQVEQIKKEIKRRKSLLVHGACSATVTLITLSKEEAYNEILDFIEYGLSKDTPDSGDSQ